MPDDPPRETKFAQAQLKGQPLDAVIGAVRALERAALMQAFEAGFRKGWEEAQSAIANALKQALPNTTISLPSSTLDNFQIEAEHKVVAKDQHLSSGEKSNANEIVFDAIQRRSGMRGVELVLMLKKSDTPLLERTVRTALWRLKNAGRITNVDGRWYTPESVPPGPLSLAQKEESDAAAS